ncbi:MAG: LacI family transcriptional regulator [Oscillospiraceae bacterium]|nr:LacI family transcriptional regulator [Oscillospiraceae bacterium]
MNESVNIFDIAKLTGVSTSTVSRVLNGHPEVSQKTRLRVQQAISEHRYIPNNSARSLSRISTDAIVVVVSGVTNPFFSRMISIIQAELEKRHYTMILQDYDPGSDTDIVDLAVSLYKEKRPRGLMFLGGNFESGHRRLRQLNIPVMLATTTILAETDRSWFSSITIDDEREAYNMASYICRNGHKRIAIIGNHQLRTIGLDKILREHGYSATEAKIKDEASFSFETGYLAARKLLEIGSYTCVFCFSDILAIGAMKAIRDKGLRIPEDISVVGFDGIEAGFYMNPALTTVKQPLEEIALHSVKGLINSIESGESYGHIVMPTTMVEGGSFRPFTG